MTGSVLLAAALGGIAWQEPASERSRKADASPVAAASPSAGDAPVPSAAPGPQAASPSGTAPRPVPRPSTTPEVSGGTPAPASQAAQDDTRRDETLPPLDVVRFTLDPTKPEVKPETRVIDLDRLPAMLRDIVGEEGVDWLPRPDFLIELKSESQGDNRSLLMRLKDSKNAHAVEVDRATDGPIKRGKPGKLIFRVPKPAGVRAGLESAGVLTGPEGVFTGPGGVFTGTMVLELTNPNWPHQGKLPVHLRIPIEVIIPGHRIVEFRMLHRVEGDPPLRVGQPASVEVAVESIGVDPGKGWLKLEWKAEGTSGSGVVPLLHLPLPISEASARSPEQGLSAWDPSDDRKGGWECHPRWLTQAVVAMDAVEEKLQVLTPGESRVLHRYRIILPDLFEPGEISGKVAWNAPVNSDEPGASHRLSGAPLKVGSGLWVGPRLAFVGEAVRIQAVLSDADRSPLNNLADEGIPVDLKGPGGASSKDKKLVRSERDSGEGYVVFGGEFRPGREGVYHVRIQEGVQGAAPFQPVAVRAAFRSDQENLPRRTPLVLFRDLAPVYWPLLGYTREDGDDRRLWRSRGRVLQPVVGLVKDTTFRFSGVFAGGGSTGALGRRVVPGDEKPRIWFSDNIRREPPPDDKWFEHVRPDEPVRAWKVSPGKEKDLYFRADISDLVDRGKPPSGTTPLLARWLILGKDANDQPFARIHHQPFFLEVATQWDYYFSAQGAIIALAVIVTVAVIYGLMKLIVMGISGQIQRNPARVPRATASPAASMLIEDPFGEPMPGPVVDGRSTVEHAPHPSDPHPWPQPIATSPALAGDGDPFGEPREDAGGTDPFI